MVEIPKRARLRCAHKVFVTRIPLSWTESYLADVFAEFGEVAGVNLMLVRQKGISAGSAFIRFDSDTPVVELTAKCDPTTDEFVEVYEDEGRLVVGLSRDLKIRRYTGATTVLRVNHAYQRKGRKYAEEDA